MTICPFCDADPFHYVDIGVGREAVAVTCCDLGDMYFRGARPEPNEVTIEWIDFIRIAEKFTRLRSERDSAFEQAAKVVDEYSQLGMWTASETRDAIASSIRSLKGT